MQQQKVAVVTLEGPPIRVSYNPGEITAFVSEVAPIRESNCLVLDGVKSISITLRIERVKEGIDLSGPTVQSVGKLVGMHLKTSQMSETKHNCQNSTKSVKIEAPPLSQSMLK